MLMLISRFVLVMKVWILLKVAMMISMIESVSLDCFDDSVYLMNGYRYVEDIPIERILMQISRIDVQTIHLITEDDLIYLLEHLDPLSYRVYLVSPIHLYAYS